MYFYLGVSLANLYKVSSKYSDQTFQNSLLFATGTFSLEVFGTFAKETMACQKISARNSELSDLLGVVGGSFTSRFLVKIDGWWIL